MDLLHKKDIQKEKLPQKEIGINFCKEGEKNTGNEEGLQSKIKEKKNLYLRKLKSFL